MYNSHLSVDVAKCFAHSSLMFHLFVKCNNEIKMHKIKLEIEWWRREIDNFQW